MTKRFLLIGIFGMLTYSCINKNRKESSVKNKDHNDKIISHDTILKVKKNDAVINKEMLYGVWAENDQDNALFEISGDSLRYTEFYDTPYFYDLDGGFNIHLNGYLSRNKILKIDKDSLLFESDMGEIIKLVKRNE